jgi:hypothetical protein
MRCCPTCYRDVFINDIHRCGMTPEHQEHLDGIVKELTADLRAKYVKGQEEHGGNIWEKPGMLDHAIEEVLDLAVYLYTLKRQLRCGLPS